MMGKNRRRSKEVGRESGKRGRSVYQRNNELRLAEVHTAIWAEFMTWQLKPSTSQWMGDQSRLNSQWTVLHWTSKVGTDVWELCSHFKQKPRLDDCSHKITEVWTALTDGIIQGYFSWWEKKRRWSSGSVNGGALSCRDAAAADSLSLQRSLGLRLKKTIHAFKPFCDIS